MIQMIPMTKEEEKQPEESEKPKHSEPEIRNALQISKKSEMKEVDNEAHGIPSGGSGS
jgi:hypothetical protein